VRAALRFACSTWGSRCLSDKRGRGRRLRFRTHRRMDALPAPGGKHTEMMQQKARRRNATPDLFLKHPNTTVVLVFWTGGVLNRLVKVYCVSLIPDDAKRHKVYTGSGNRCPTSSLRERSRIPCTEVLVVGAYKRGERGS